MKIQTELKVVDNRKETILDKYIDNFLAGNIKNIIIKEEWIMLIELREKYVANLQELESKDIELLVQARLKEEEEKIRQDVVSKHNDEILLAKLKVQAVDEMMADQEKLQDCNTEDLDNVENRENMEV